MTRLDDIRSHRLFATAWIIMAMISTVVAQDQATEPAGTLQLDGDDDSTLRDALEMLSDEQLRDTPLTLTEPTSQSIFTDRIAELGSTGFKLPPLAALTTGMSKIGNGSIPAGYQGDQTLERMPLPETGQARGLAMQTTFAPWAAPNTFSHPLYFEDRMLERHGHVRLGHFQPLASGTRFIAQAAMLPYLSTLASPGSCDYSLGYYRAGSCVPAFLQRPPYKRKAVAAQLSATAIGATILP
ncbi:MAG: hypothetical protein AAGJ83_07365 [Planctomycetota bacterium]